MASILKLSRFSFSNILSSNHNDITRLARFMSRLEISDLSHQKPKRPPSAFALFFKDNYSEVAKQNVGAKASDLSKIIGPMWKQLDDVEKHKYQDHASGVLANYKKEKEKFLQALTTDQKKQLEDVRKQMRMRRRRGKNERLSKELNKPKKPAQNGYALYISQQLKSRPPQSFQQASQMFKEVSKNWQSMAMKEKEGFNTKAEDDKKRYQAELKAWETRMMSEGHKELVRKTVSASSTSTLKKKKESTAAGTKKSPKKSV